MDNIFGTILSGELTVKAYLLCTAVSLLCGLIAAVCAAFKSSVSKSFIACLILLPPIVETVILMVNGNVGTGIAVAGAFSLVRFRSVPGKAREIAAIFLAMTAGLTCAAGYLGIALLFAVAVGLIMALISIVPMKSDKELEMRITVPESLNFNDMFDDIFKKYTGDCKLIEVKTTNMGSLYRLKYKIMLKNGADKKAFIDELRVRNGNLEIALCQAAGRNEEL